MSVRTSPALRGAYDAAEAIRARAYPRGSTASVGAALLVPSGYHVAAVSVGHPAARLSLCAERVCIAKAIAAGYSEFHGIAVAGSDGARILCRDCQVFLREFCAETMPVVFSSGGVLVEVSLASLPRTAR